VDKKSVASIGSLHFCLDLTLPLQIPLSGDWDMTGQAKIIRKPKWHLIYYILAVFYLVTISGSLWLNRSIMGVYTSSVDVNKELAEIQGHFIDLGRLASAVNAPGNDVFDSGDVDAELARRNQALERFEQSMSTLRTEVQEKVGAKEAAPLIDGLDDIETAMGVMVTEADLIFSYLRENRTEEAGHRMATMDQKYAGVTGSVADASSFVRSLQSKHFDEQIAVASSLRKFEYLIGGIIALMVCSVTLYGHMIARKMKQAQVEALNTRLGRIVEESVNEIYVFDADTLRFLQVNRGARENLGYTLEELYALTPIDLKPEFTPETFEGLLKPLRDGTREQVVFETVHRRKDGSAYDVEVRLHFARAETPQVFVASIQDITEIRAHQEQLRQVQKMDAVGQLTGGVAHDFNNLLTVITGSLELLEAKVQQNDQRQLISEAQEAAELGAKLTKQLLAFARRQPLDPKVIDLNELVMDMSDWLRRTLGETVQVKLVLAEDLNKTRVDPGQIENAILNLAINARDAMPNGGILTIETANIELDEDYATSRRDVSPGRYVVLSVTDNGSGIAPEVEERIFEPFFTTKEEKSGAGLGLSMVYGFAKQSGGHVALHSELGRGTTVDLYLPQTSFGVEAAAVQEVQGAFDTVAEALAARGETVLVVEDNPRVRRVTVKRLTDLGYIVLEAEDGKAALEILEKEQSIDLLFTDVLMPGGMTGGDLARAAQHLRSGIRILFTSGYPSDAAIRERRGDSEGLDG
jgi:PAS domain S-box-containing protein